MSKNTKVTIGIVVILGVCSLVAVYAILGISSWYLARSTSDSSAQYFLTVGEVLSRKDNVVNRQLRISGAVIGESIEFDEASQTLSFLIADVPADNTRIIQEGGLSTVLENAVNDPKRQRIQIVFVGEKPELLRNAAQAIMIGELRSDGIFYADEILLQCPARYEEAVPDQAVD